MQRLQEILIRAWHLRGGAIARADGIMVLTIHAGPIGEITGFADPELFPLFGPDPDGLAARPGQLSSPEDQLSSPEDLRGL